MKEILKEARQLIDPDGVPQLLPWEYIYFNFFPEKRNLFFIDVGAYDGLRGSNTALFELYLGWDGICIEPNKSSYEQLLKSRKCKTYNLCIGDKNTVGEFWEGDGGLAALSGLHDSLHNKHIDRIGNKYSKKQIEIRTLSSIMDDNNIINVDYLSIDVE